MKLNQYHNYEGLFTNKVVLMEKGNFDCVLIIHSLPKVNKYSYLPIRSPPVSKWVVIHLNHSSKTTYSAAGISPSLAKFSTKQYL